MPTYLVERYWPGVTTQELREALERGCQVIEEMSSHGDSIRDISCTLLPGEEVVFSVYDGPSATAVQQFNERACIPFSRIVEAIVIVRGQVGSGGGTRYAPAATPREFDPGSATRAAIRNDHG